MSFSHDCSEQNNGFPIKSFGVMKALFASSFETGNYQIISGK
jgi:hypothetical protein